jgi:hypothetical protein
MESKSQARGLTSYAVQQAKGGKKANSTNLSITARDVFFPDLLVGYKNMHRSGPTIRIGREHR